MRKFRMVPSEFYDSLLSKTTVDDFSEQLLNETLADKQTSVAQKHAQYNQRIQGYLDHQNRMLNKPVKVTLENGEQVIAQVPQKPAQAVASTQTGEVNETTAETTPTTPKKRRSRKSVKINESEPAEQKPAPMGDHTATPVKTGKSLEPKMLEEINKTIEEIQETGSPSPKAKKRKAKEIAADLLVKIIDRNKKKFGVDKEGSVISSGGVAIAGSNYLDIIKKHKEGILTNYNGDRPLQAKLLEMPETQSLASTLFGKPPRTPKGPKSAQKGKGIMSAKPWGRFKVRNWCL